MSDNIIILDKHDGALKVWRKMEIFNAILIHFDAHFDCENIEGIKRINIGNFVAHAAKEGIVKKIFWVVPSGVMSKKCCVKTLYKMLTELCKYIRFDKKKNSFFCFLKNSLIQVVVCENGVLDTVFDRFSAVDPIFVDIDMDYFFNNHICFDFSSVKSKNKDDKIKEFVYDNKDLFKETKVFTICKSIIGGYTPLKYDYTAEYLHKLITNTLKNTFEKPLKKIKPHDLLSDAELLLSKLCFIIEDGKANRKTIEEFIKNYSKYSEYVGNIYQYIKMSDYKELQSKLLIAKQLSHKLYMRCAISLGIILPKEYVINANDEIDYYLLGKYYWKNTQYSLSITYLEKAIKIMNTYSIIQDWEGVATSFHETYDISPVRIDIITMLADAKKQCGNVYEARVLLKYLSLCLGKNINLQNLEQHNNI